MDVAPETTNALMAKIKYSDELFNQVKLEIAQLLRLE